jgi:quinol monooxygenase YgiN
MWEEWRQAEESWEGRQKTAHFHNANANVSKFIEKNNIRNSPVMAHAIPMKQTLY